MEALLPLLLVFMVVMMFMSFRQRRKQMTEQDTLQKSLVVGDVVVMTSGISGTVVDLEDEKTLDLEIAPDVVTTWLRGAVREKLGAPGDGSAVGAPGDGSAEGAPGDGSAEGANPGTPTDSAPTSGTPTAPGSVSGAGTPTGNGTSAPAASSVGLGSARHGDERSAGERSEALTGGDGTGVDARPATESP